MARICMHMALGQDLHCKGFQIWPAELRMMGCNMREVIGPSCQAKLIQRNYRLMFWHQERICLQLSLCCRNSLSRSDSFWDSLIIKQIIVLRAAQIWIKTQVFSYLFLKTFYLLIYLQPSITFFHYDKFLVNILILPISHQNGFN